MWKWMCLEWNRCKPLVEATRSMARIGLISIPFNNGLCSSRRRLNMKAPSSFCQSRAVRLFKPSHNCICCTGFEAKCFNCTPNRLLRWWNSLFYNRLPISLCIVWHHLPWSRCIARVGVSVVVSLKMTSRSRPFVGEYANLGIFRNILIAICFRVS